MDNLITKLTQPFDLWQHELREVTKKDGNDWVVTNYLTYVGIEHAIGRLNAVLGGAWSWTVVSFTVGPGDKPSVVVHGRITYKDDDGAVQHRDGLGAASFTSGADDLDKVVKSAQAEAFKKATHQFGMAAYLWDKGLADQIAIALLAENGWTWKAPRKPGKPRKGNDVAKDILGSLTDQPQPEPYQRPKQQKQQTAPQAQQQGQQQAPAEGKAQTPRSVVWAAAMKALPGVGDGSLSTALQGFIAECHPDKPDVGAWTLELARTVADLIVKQPAVLKKHLPKHAQG